MSGFSELIKSFDKTRDYVRDFFIYGFKVRNEFNRKSSRTYDDEKRRVESWLGDFLRYDNTKRGKQVSISVDSGHIYENPLYNAYYSKSFTDNDIKLHFMLCDILAEDGLTAREAAERLNEVYGEVFDEQTVRVKLKEYADEGLVTSERRGRSDVFHLSTDTAESFFGEYEGLDDAVKFFSGSSEFGVVGDSLLKTAGLKNDIFLRKHNYIVHTLEDEVLLQILDAAEKKQLITAVNFNGGASSENAGIPLKIYASAQTGRRYLIMYIPRFRRFSSFRLDFIKRIKVMGEYPDYDKCAEMLKTNESKCFGVSFGNRRERDNPGGRVNIVFYADPNRERHIIERLEREKRCGTVEKTGDNLYTYTADVFDPNEMMHWVKSFIGRVVSVEGAGEGVIGRFRRDVERMHRIYLQKEGDK